MSASPAAMVEAIAGEESPFRRQPQAVLPRPRGPLSLQVLSAFARAPGSFGVAPSLGGIDPLSDDDLHLALYLCYELHYRDMLGVDSEWEWDPDLLRFRATLEYAFIVGVREVVGPVTRHYRGDVRSAFIDIIANAAGPSLSEFLVDVGTSEQLREFCIHRSAYQLKEADPHTFSIPRLSGKAKSAMVEIQYDEYGSGDASAMHSTLFAATMEALGLEPTYGFYVDQLPGFTLATVNLISLFGLHRRWRGAAVGHLAVFEMTSIEPMGRYSRALERFGVGSDGRRFYDVHVEADARHGAIALDEMVPALVASDQSLGEDLIFGAAAVLMIENRFSQGLLSAWASGSASLLRHSGVGARDLASY